MGSRILYNLKSGSFLRIDYLSIKRRKKSLQSGSLFVLQACFQAERGFDGFVLEMGNCVVIS